MITVVVLPGAEGIFENETLNLLEQKYHVITCPIRWNKKDVHSSSNRDIINNLCPKTGKYYLFGHSMSNRIVAIMLADKLFVNAPTAIIMSSFPFYRNPILMDRVLELRRLPEDVKLLMISGDSDSYIKDSNVEYEYEQLKCAIPSADEEMYKIHLKVVVGGLHKLAKKCAVPVVHAIDMFIEFYDNQ